MNFGGQRVPNSVDDVKRFEVKGQYAERRLCNLMMPICLLTRVGELYSGYLHYQQCKKSTVFLAIKNQTALELIVKQQAYMHT